MPLKRGVVTRAGIGGRPREVLGRVHLSLVFLLGMVVVVSGLFFWRADRTAGERKPVVPNQFIVAAVSEPASIDVFDKSSKEGKSGPDVHSNRRGAVDRKERDSAEVTIGTQAEDQGSAPVGSERRVGGEGLSTPSGLELSRSNDPPAEDQSEGQEEDDPPIRSLAGWVFDEAGVAVADLGVVAEPRRLVPVEAGIGGIPFQNSGSRTDGGGYFVFPNLSDGEYAIKTEDTDTFESTTGHFRTGVDSAVLIVIKKTDQRAVIRGFVESSEGGSLEGVQVLPVGQVESPVSTNGLGAYVLSLPLDSRHRSLILRFVLDGYREHRTTVDDAELRSGAEVIRDVFLERLREKTSVSGSVVSGDGSPIYRAHIQLFSASIGRRADGVSDRDGMFSIPDVEHAEDYRLWVRPPDGFKDYLEENLVVTGWVDLDIVLEDVGWARLEGQMIDPGGRPVPGFTLWLSTSQPSNQNNIPVTGDDFGRFVVERLPEGSATLATQASPVLTFSGIQLVAGNFNNAQLRLDTGVHGLGGFVLDSDDRPVAAARIVLLWSSVEGGIRSNSRRETHGDANGYFLLSNLGEGLHTLTVSAHGFRSERQQVETSDHNQEILIRLFEIAP